MEFVTVSELQEEFSLEILVDTQNNIEITTEDINRPGLELTGYFKFFPTDRIQILGRGEVSYLSTLSEERLEKAIKKFIKHKPLCIIVTRKLDLPSILINEANTLSVPILRTDEKTTNFISKLNNYLQKKFAKTIGIHGVCVDVYGVGILIRGSSGIGKSEIALSLIERGHRLIADDLVILKQIGPHALIGSANEYNKEFISLRGVGLVNVPRIYGSGSYQKETKINLDILLSPWNDNTYYDAIGYEEKKVNYLDTFVKHIEIPIRPGRDIAGLIEVAAKNYRLRESGYDSKLDFERRFKK